MRVVELKIEEELGMEYKNRQEEKRRQDKGRERNMNDRKFAAGLRVERGKEKDDCRQKTKRVGLRSLGGFFLWEYLTGHSNLKCFFGGSCLTSFKDVYDFFD